MIQAFARIAPHHTDWDMVILGEGAERAALEALVQQEGLKERVSLPGRAGNIGDWYGSADLYVLSSRFEGLSNTLLESMASGLASVCFDCDTGPREIVTDGLNGRLVQPNGDVGAMAQALSAVMADEPLRLAMAQQAIAIRERFSAQRVLELWQALFDDVGGEQNARRNAS